MSPKRYIVTGGGGFVGRALCHRLRQAGHRVVSLSRSTYPELLAIGVDCLQRDLAKSVADLASRFDDVDGVFHVAAKVDMWGDFQDFFQANVVATRNVIELCRLAQIKKLVFTSSPSVVAAGTDLINIDETVPYPRHYDAYYPQTKAQSEQEVLAANGAELRTVALRPHLIFGPGDTNLIPTILNRARSGRLFQIGSGNNLVDLTFIDDCISAHILAMEALDRDLAVGGQCFFISQGQPVKLWWWIDAILGLYGLPPITKKVPRSLAMTIAYVSEGLVKILPGLRQPFLTRFLVGEMSTSHYFNISKARNLLRYSPRYSIEETFPLILRIPR